MVIPSHPLMSWLILPIYEFVLSKKSDFLLEQEVENHIQPNYIITLTEIKKAKGGERFKRSLEIRSSFESKEEEKILDK